MKLTPPGNAVIQLECRTDSALWSETDVIALATRVMEAVVQSEQLQDLECELSIVFSDDATVRDLNRQHRGKDKATNVLSWPAQTLAPAKAGGRPRAPKADAFGEVPLGDVALAYETCAREAQAQGKPLRNHVTHLVLHGVLHLLGYDHETEADATRMEELERDILGKLGIDDPY